MNIQFKHNLVSGWRNILKYKTQNIISILCLSVGTAVFATTITILIVLWDGGLWAINDKNSFEVHFNNTSGEIVECTPDMICRIRQLSTVDDFNYSGYITHTEKAEAIERIDYIIDKNGKRYKAPGTIRVVSPNYFKYYRYKSAITGMDMPTLKNGAFIMVDSIRNRYLTKDFNPAGYDVKGESTYLISDVLKTNFNFLNDRQGYYIVDDCTSSKNYIPHIYSGHISMKEGVDIDKCKHEIEQNFPQYKTNIKAIDNNVRYLAYTSVGIIIFLSASVLIIGLTGYLKMQIQLFNLRSKELALRRCNGAKPFHLFMLLVAELMIMFFFVIIITFVLLYGMMYYLCYEFSMNFSLDFSSMVLSFDSDRMLFDGLVILIIISTFLISIVISWFLVRRIINFPLSEIAGKSYSPKSKMHGVIQIIQFFVATILFYFIFIALYRINKINTDYTNPISFYKQVVSINQDERYHDIKNLSQKVFPSAKYIGETSNVVWTVRDSLDYEIYLGPKFITHKDENGLYNYNVRIVTPSIFSIMNETIQAEWSPQTYPVYTLSFETNNIIKMLNLKHRSSNYIYKSPSGLEYKRIGFAHGMDDDKSCNMNLDFYIVYSKNNWIKTYDEFINCYRLTDNVYILSKDGKFTELCHEINQYIHEIDPTLYHNAEYPISTIRECYFGNDIFCKQICNLNYLLAIISIISIILSVYSSIALDTRGRQKEVAIRKINGAKAKNIVMMFSRYYVITLLISFILVAVIGNAILYLISLFSKSNDLDFQVYEALSIPYLLSVVIITLITVATILYKIYKIAHTYPSKMINRE